MKWLIWNQPLGRLDDPYMRRWCLTTPWFSIRIHHWFRGDDDRHYHDHDWNFICMVLKGSYMDVSYLDTSYGSDVKMDILTPFSPRYRKAEYKHIVNTSGCWTIVLTGPKIRNFGFWVPNTQGKMVWFKAKRYFLKYGHQ
jgi:hypothetical protein